MKIYPRGTNPAVALYKLWHTLIAAQHPHPLTAEVPLATRYNPYHNRYSRDRYPIVGFGPHEGGAITVSGFDQQQRPVLWFGRRWHQNYLDPRLALDADGRFFLYSLWGNTQREQVAQATFLNFGYAASRIRWFVDCDHTYHCVDLHDPANPVRYHHANVVTGRWLRLRRSGPIWDLEPALNQLWPSELAQGHNAWGQDNDTALAHARQVYDYDVALRERRYTRLARSITGKQGRTSTARITEAGQPIGRDQAVTRLVALLEVRTPAKSTPKRPKEAHDGKHDLASTNNA